MSKVIDLGMRQLSKNGESFVQCPCSETSTWLAVCHEGRKGVFIGGLMCSDCEEVMGLIDGYIV